MPIDLKSDLRAALADIAPELAEHVRRVVREEVLLAARGGDVDELLDTASTARLLGQTPNALRRAAERGRSIVKPVRGVAGRHLRFRRGDVLAAIATRAGTP